MLVIGFAAAVRRYRNNLILVKNNLGHRRVWAHRPNATLPSSVTILPSLMRWWEAPAQASWSRNESFSLPEASAALTRCCRAGR